MVKRPVEKYDFRAFGEAIKAARTRCKESRKSLYADYGKLKKQVKEYDVIKQNIDSILRLEKEPERDKGKEREADLKTTF